jgi:thiol-disulfide isomerase/thioredoxin
VKTTVHLLEITIRYVFPRTLLLLTGSAAMLVAFPAEGRPQNESGWIGHPAPEISAGEWLNSPPIHLSELRGKVVLLEFWTFACSNCRNTLPYLRKWNAIRAGGKFEIIGVHTPELKRERDISALRKETESLGITWPIVTNNEYTTWNAYHQQYWPVIYLIDKRGTFRYVHIGEGAYVETEVMIARLIAESDR